MPGFFLHIVDFNGHQRVEGPMQLQRALHNHSPRIKVPAGPRHLCNVRLALDMTSDRRCILVKNENRVDVNI